MAESGNEKKIVLKASGASSVNSSDITQNSAAIPADGEIKDPMNMRNTDTDGMRRVSASNNSAKRTIKLKPLKPKKEEPKEEVGVETTQIPSPHPTTAGSVTTPANIHLSPSAPAAETQIPEEAQDETVSMDRTNLSDDDSTVKMPKPASANPSVPGSKQTIKLRPSNTPPASASAETAEAPAPFAAAKATIKLTPKSEDDSDETQSIPGVTPPSEVEQTTKMAKQTIRLVPKKPGAAKPSAPTVKLGEPSPDATDDAGGIKPSSPTVKLSPKPETDQTQEITDAPPAAAAKPKIGIKRRTTREDDTHAESAAASADNAAMPDFEDSADNASNEPGLIFTLASVITLCAIGYFTFMLFKQYQMWIG
jgi:hypothetical protein